MNSAYHAPQSRVRPSTGFTLVELVMMIVLLGILAIVVVPSFNSRPFIERGFHDEVISAARHAQKLAVASGCDVQLHITATGYQLLARAGCTSGAFSNPVAHPARPGGFADEAPDGVGIGGADIEFNPDGSSEGGSVTVGSRSFSVATTGHVSAS